MSRIGKQTIEIPEGVTIKIDGQQVSVKGPKGELTEKLSNVAVIEQKEKKIKVTVKNPEVKSNRALWGLSRMLIANMVEGVTKGYEKKLEVNGVGFKVDLQGKKLVLHVGFSHPVEFELPEEIEGKVEKNVITLSGINKQLVGNTAAQVRSIRKPEPYKGKGIKYIDETIRRKAGKVAKGVEGTA
jgi:large subunit ribosomal protein L6